MRIRHRGFLVALGICGLGLMVTPLRRALAAGAAPRPLLLDGAMAGSTVVVVGERGTILRSVDGASSWRTATTTATATLTGVSFAGDGQRGWAVGHDALILATTDGGQTWRKQFQGENLQDSFLDVLAVDGPQVIAVGAYGLFLATADAGQTWVRRKVLDDDHHLNRISRGPAGTLYLAGEHGTLLRSTDNGTRWSRLPAPYEGSFYGILPLDRRTLVAYGLRGRVYRSVDDGDTWQLVATPQPVLLATAVRLRSNTLILGGNARSLFVSRDYGKSVAVLPWPAGIAPGAVAELLELPDGALLALGEAGPVVVRKPE